MTDPYPASIGAKHFLPVSKDGNSDTDRDIINLPRDQGVKRFLETTLNQMQGAGRRRLDAPMEPGKATHGPVESGSSAFFRWQEETRGQPLPPGERKQVESGMAGVFNRLFTEIPRTDVHVPMVSRLADQVPVMRDAGVQPGLTHGNDTVTHTWFLDQRCYGSMYTSLGQMNAYIPEGLPTFVEARDSSDVISPQVHILSVPELAYREYTRKVVWPEPKLLRKSTTHDQGVYHEPTFRTPAQVYHEWRFAGLPYIMHPQADATILQAMWLENVINKIATMKDVFCNGPRQRAKNGYHMWMILVVRTDGHEQEERVAQLNGLLGKGGWCGYSCQNETHEHARYTRPEFYTSASSVIPYYVYNTAEWKGRKIYLGQVQEFSPVDVDDSEPDSDDSHSRMISTVNLALYRKSNLDSELRQQRDAIQALSDMQVSVCTHD